MLRRHSYPGRSRPVHEEPAAATDTEAELFTEHVRRENTRERLPLPRPYVVALGLSEPVLLSFAEYWQRHPERPLAEAQRRYHEEHKRQQQAHLAWLKEEAERRRETCRRALNDDSRFRRVVAAVQKVEAKWRRKGVNPIEVLRRETEVWLALRITVENAGRKPDRRASEWANDCRRAVACVGGAINTLATVLARHPWARGLERNHAVEDLVRAHQRLATDFPKRRRGRPRAGWRDWLEASLHPEDATAYAIEGVKRAAGLVEKSPKKSPRK